MSAANNPISASPAWAPPGRFNAVSGRYSVEAKGDDPYYTRPFARSFERNWDVTGGYSPIMAVPQVNGWQRGELYRTATPVLKLTWYGPMYDPTNPADWQGPGGG